MKTRLALGLVTLFAACDDGGDGGGNIFEPKPECEGADVVPFMGDQQMVISELNIAPLEEGFDLDGDGMVDNKLAPLSALARAPIEDAFEDFSIIIPVEFFDFPTATADSCVNFAFYLGVYKFDRDGDGAKTAEEGGDCNDDDLNVKPGGTEVADNGKDDDCDGLTDESAENVPSTSTADTDGDGVTIAMGDCDDNDVMTKPGGMEICGDGKDNDCASGADWSKDAMANLVCTPFVGGTPDELALDPLSFKTGTMEPLIEFNSASTKDAAGSRSRPGGPPRCSAPLPVADNITPARRSTCATIAAEVTTDGGVSLTGGRLGGVLDAKTLDTLRNIPIEQIMLKAEDSFLDAIFTNPTLSVIITLPKIDTDGDGETDCATPDIDVDQDGLEGYCNKNLDGDAETNVVDTCIDGDGTVYKDGDMGVPHCTQIMNPDGTFKFVDGVSVALTFKTTPAKLIQE